MEKQIGLLTSDVIFGTKAQLLRRRNALKLSATKLRPSFEASATPPPGPKPAENLAVFRERWRPKMGPGEKIPQKVTSAETIDFEELEKQRIEKIRETWRPAVGPASTI